MIAYPGACFGLVDRRRIMMPHGKSRNEFGKKKCGYVSAASHYFLQSEGGCGGSYLRR